MSTIATAFDFTNYYADIEICVDSNGESDACRTGVNLLQSRIVPFCMGSCIQGTCRMGTEDWSKERDGTFMKDKKSCTPDPCAVVETDRVYSTVFKKSQTRFINWEIRLKFPEPGSGIEFPIHSGGYNAGT
jgi:hypothetical protein